MLYNKIDAISLQVRGKLMLILEKKVKLLFNQNKTNIVKYFCAVSEFGSDITNYELETIEILFGRQGYPYSVIEIIYQMNYLINSRDYVLTDREHFENAVQLLNDDIVDVTTTEYQAPHKIVWAMILLKALYGMENLPAFGDALKYVGESFEEFGWTQPPIIFLNNDKMENIFTHYDKHIVEQIKAIPNIETILEKETKATELPEASDFLENYLKQNIALMVYIEDKWKEINAQINNVLSNG
jgi:hypothetical protein